MARGRNYELSIAIGGQTSPTLAAAVSRASASINSLNSVAKKAAAGVGAAFAAVKIKDFVGNAVDTFKTYEQSLATTAATAGVAKGTESYEKLNEAARAAGKATSKTAAEAADALGYMALAGWDVDQSIGGLMPILRLSEATQADLATTSDLVTDSMAALGIAADKEGNNLKRYLDVAAMANNKSNQTATQLMEAYIGVGGSLNRLGTPLEESGALLGVLAR